MIKFLYHLSACNGQAQKYCMAGLLSQESQIGSSSGLIRLLLVSLETPKSLGQRRDLNKDSLGS